MDLHPFGNEWKRWGMLGIHSEPMAESSTPEGKQKQQHVDTLVNEHSPIQ
jgi:hypothetical protein